MTQAPRRDHGGGLDRAIATFGGARETWLDLSTGINPTPYPLPDLPTESWQRLPDSDAQTALEQAARQFWHLPEAAQLAAANGASALIALLPHLVTGRHVTIPGPTYNEHEAAFAAQGWQVKTDLAARAEALVLVHPNNPDGRLWQRSDFDPEAYRLIVIDESFAEVTPDQSLVALAARPNVVVLKSFGKFWGLAGLRLGFAISAPEFHRKLMQLLGPWPVSGPALQIGKTALSDRAWVAATRQTLRRDGQKLDQLAKQAGLRPIGGSDLFRLFDCADAAALQTHLARHQIWSRIFPYSRHWLRLGLPGRDAQWRQLEAALAALK